MLSEQFIWFGSAVAFLAGIGYVVATVRGQARPNRVSWGLWSITSWLAFAGQLDEGVGTAAVLTAVVALVPSLIFLASFVGGAYWKFSKLDIACCALWTFALVAWQLTASGIVAILLSITVDAIAGIPTVVKAWREPESESHIAYTAGMFSAACTLLTLTEFTLATAAFAIYFFILCATISFLLLVAPRWRRAAARRRPHHAAAVAGTGRGSRPGAAFGPDVASATDPDAAHCPPVTPATHSSRGPAARLLVVAVVAVLVTGTAAPAWWPWAATQDSATTPIRFTGTDGLTSNGFTRNDDFTRAGDSDAAAPAPPPPSMGVAAGIAVPTVREMVAVGPTPGHLEIAPNGRFALIAHRAAGIVSVLDTTINKITATVPIPAGPPRFVSFSPDSSRAYISVYDDQRTINVVAVLDVATSTLLATVPVGRRPGASAVTPDGTQLWVPSHDDGRVDIIDTASNTLRASVPVPANPHWVAFSADGRRAWIANHESNLVTVLDPATTAVLATIDVGDSPHSTAVSPGSAASAGQAAVTNYDDNTVSLIDTSKIGTSKIGTATQAVVAVVPVGHNPQDLAYAPDGRYLYTANVTADTVSVIDTAAYTVTATIPTCDGPTSIAAHPSGRLAYVTCLNSGEVLILDTTADPTTPGTQR